MPLQARLQKITKRVHDDVFGAQAEPWDLGLQSYSLLKRRAKVDGNVTQAIRAAGEAATAGARS